MQHDKGKCSELVPPVSRVSSAGSELTQGYPANAMQAHPVSKAVGNVRNDEPELVEPIGAPLSYA